MTEPAAGGANGADEHRAGLVRLVTDHHAAVYRYAYRLTGQTADAEDLSQQTFAAACQHYDQLRDPAKVVGWLLATVRNTYFKSRRRQPFASLDSNVVEIDELAVWDDHELPFDREQLQAALDELPPEFKVVVLMFYFEHQSYQEIAAALDVPPGTVMSRLSRAKGHLRSRLLDLGWESPAPVTRPLTETPSRRPVRR